MLVSSVLPGGARLAAHPRCGGFLHGKDAQEATKINTYLYTMAYDPTTENETPWEDHGIDHDDGDDDDGEYTTPLSSPIKPPPEEIEMRQLPREQNGRRRQQNAWGTLKKLYPQADEDALEVSYVKRTWRNNLSVGR